jgi:hypothetical protein
MAFNINGALVETSQSALKMTASSIVGLDTNSSGFVTLSSRPWFIAYRNTGWVTYTGNAWNTIPFDVAYVNNGSHYNTGTNRFTAPVTGTYYFTFCSYGYKNPSTNADSYTHPTLWVNGSSTLRQASQTTAYRLRSRTNASSSYSWDLQINDILYLTAGDYVQVYVYCNGTQQWYGYYTHFTGTYLG